MSMIDHNAIKTLTFVLPDVVSVPVKLATSASSLIPTLLLFLPLSSPLHRYPLGVSDWIGRNTLQAKHCLVYWGAKSPSTATDLQKVREL